MLVESQMDRGRHSVLAQTVSWFCGIVLLLSLETAAQNGTTPAVSLEIQREMFLRASSELKTGAGPAFRPLRGQLDGYPLLQYLEYERLLSTVDTVTPAEAHRFLAEVQSTPLHDSFLHRYLQNKGRNRHWQAFLAIASDAPNDTELQCYFYRAKRSAGDVATAWLGAERLWNVGRSQHEACDPLFKRWMVDGPGPTDPLIWSRALKAFDGRSPHLIAYVGRFASEQLQPLLTELAEVYRYPEGLLRDTHSPSPVHAQLVTVGVRRLARVNPEKGRLALERVRTRQPLSDQQIEAVEAMIIRHSLFAKSSPVETWIGERLARLRDDELTEIYLRNQVEESHWQALLDGVQWLSPERRFSDTWRYWAARAMHSLGDQQAAEAIFIGLAGKRSFHGFLSAQRMGTHYQLAIEQRLIDLWQPASHARDVLARMQELALLNRWPEARAEWLFLVDTLDRAEREQAMRYALEQEWFDLSIATSLRAGAWDHIDARFPLAFEELLSELAAAEGVTTSELQAIARRESAMYPEAESGAGALGLMQVMPSTGKQVAGQLKLPWKRAKLFVSEYNARIASHYYRQLLDRFDDNRVMALAGYNAGPHRVDRWRTAMPADQWIESLPFKETRDYVQAVLAYTVIYDLQSGRKPDILRPHEWRITSG